MTYIQKDLWQIIRELEQLMPLSTEKVESVMGYKPVEKKQNGPYTVFSSAGPQLLDGMAVATLTLMLRTPQEFVDNSAFGMELSGTCITLPQVRRHFANLELTQPPRGRSLDEVEAWAVERPWGILSFGFKQDRPDCLFQITFTKNRR